MLVFFCVYFSVLNKRQYIGGALVAQNYTNFQSSNIYPDVMQTKLVVHIKKYRADAF